MRTIIHASNGFRTHDHSAPETQTLNIIHIGNGWRYFVTRYVKNLIARIQYRTVNCSLLYMDTESLMANLLRLPVQGDEELEKEEK
jgi:hypothetical protein